MNACNWRAWTSMWELLALSFRYPTYELADAYASGEWRAAAEELCILLNVDVPSECRNPSASRTVTESEIDNVMHGLRIESTRLFFGPDGVVVSPYEGVWDAKKRGVEALTFVSPKAMEMERIAEKMGLGRPGGTNESLDMIATELEMLEFYAASIAEADDSDVEHIGELERGYREFLENHAQSWMPEFCASVKEQTLHEFYRMAASLLSHVLIGCQKR